MEIQNYNQNGNSSDQSSTNLLKINKIEETGLSPNSISEEIIKARIYWLAADLVSQWRSLPAERWDLETIFQELNPELKESSANFTLTHSLLINCLAYSQNSYRSLLVEIEESYSQQFGYLKNQDKVKLLIPATVDITKFLNTSIEECTKQLQNNFESVTTNAYQKLEMHFYYLRDFGTDSVIDCTVLLMQELELLIKKYESDCQIYEDLIDSSKQSFNNLSFQLLEKFKWLMQIFSKKPTVDEVFYALFMSYKLQFELKLFSAGYQLLKMLKERVDKYIDSVSTIDRWLSELQL